MSDKRNEKKPDPVDLADSARALFIEGGVNEFDL